MSDTRLQSGGSSPDDEPTKTLSNESALARVQVQVQDQARKVADAAGQVGRTLAGQTDAARGWAGERAGIARDWAIDQGDVIRDTVQVRPFISVGVSAASAFAAGLLLGVLLARR